MTIDAMGCQTLIARDIVAAKADYVLSVKGNQPTLREEIKAFFLRAIVNGFDERKVKISRHETREYAHPQFSRDDIGTLTTAPLTMKCFPRLRLEGRPKLFQQPDHYMPIVLQIPFAAQVARFLLELIEPLDPRRASNQCRTIFPRPPQVAHAMHQNLPQPIPKRPHAAGVLKLKNLTHDGQLNFLNPVVAVDRSHIETKQPRSQQPRLQMGMTHPLDSARDPWIRFRLGFVFEPCHHQVSQS